MTLTPPLAVKANEQGLPEWCRATVACLCVCVCVSSVYVSLQWRLLRGLDVAMATLLQQSWWWDDHMFLVDSGPPPQKKCYTIVICKKEPRSEALREDRWNKKLKKENWMSLNSVTEDISDHRQGETGKAGRLKGCIELHIRQKETTGKDIKSESSSLCPPPLFDTRTHTFSVCMFGL